MDFIAKPEIDSLDLLVIPIEDPATPPASLGTLPADTAALARLELDRGAIRSGKGDSVVIPSASGPQRIALLGLGSAKEGRAEALRVLGSRAVKTARTLRAASLAIAATDGDDQAADTAALVEGILLGAYRYERFKTGHEEDGRGADDGTQAPDPTRPHPSSFGFLGVDDAASDAADRAARVARAANWARDLANNPGNFMTPELLAAEARELADAYDNLSCTVLTLDEIENEGLGLVAAVGQGSVNEPRVIVLEWNPPGDTRPNDERLAFVGKAITFDTGGISIKPSGGMPDMKMDKAGGCAVLGAMRAIAALGIERRILAVVGSAENMPGGNAYKPGDVITARDGTTIEVTNTDAEGRLVLGDSICWARHLGCAAIVELSTLTGAIVVALGHHFSGAVARSGALTDAVLASSTRTGDPAWHLPMHDAYKSALRSECADMVNSGPRWAGSLYAGLFLEHFAGDTPFVHLDVAGTAMLPKPQRYYGVKGASGWGVRLLADLAETFDPTES